MNDSKVGIFICLGLRLGKRSRFAQVSSLQFILKRFISRFGEQGFLLKDSPDTHGFFKHVDASSSIHAKVNHRPVKTFCYIFLLLCYKHGMIEELLELLIVKDD